jgi:LruC domain-containing protein
MKLYKRCLLPCLIASLPAFAEEPFSACPSEAFLIQDTIAKLYGVELATGHYQLLSDEMGTANKLNAIAFNFHDDFLYAWSSEYQTLVRIGSDYKVNPLATNGNPNKTFYVGDVSLEENIYYAYRPGSEFGLYAYTLDETSPDYLEARRIVDGGTLNMKIFDFAFHPFNSYAYSVDSQGKLYEIDVNLGTARVLSEVGVSGTFGAVYFDVSGRLYFSRNSDGHVFRLDVAESEPLAEFFAFGPSSSNNDGARCAMAPIVSEVNAEIDFGDAPDSYGTTLDQNGARHGLKDSLLVLGALVDGESDSYTFPLSDEETADADEDGVVFVTNLEIGEEALVQVQAQGEGYLNAWIDWDRNGVFDIDEQIISAQSLTEGENIQSFPVPLAALVGDTWARFRYSSTANLGATGGVADGEVEDYAVTVSETGVSSVYYPSAQDWSTLAYEDNWPSVGDYDMNDMVLHYRTAISKNETEVRRVRIQGQLAAVGASYHNGFAVHLPGILRSQIRESGIEFTINRKNVALSPLEVGRPEAIFIVFENSWAYVSAGEDCKYYRTEPQCASDIQMEFSISIPFKNALPLADMPDVPFDPFLFATANTEHNPLVGSRPGRSLEIHLKNKPPTSAFNPEFLGMGDDASDTSAGRYFQTENGMPWAMHIANRWMYPKEYMDVLYTYPKFEGFVSSSGSTNRQWYLHQEANRQNTFE